MKQGTLITAFVTHGFVLLLSDGRVVNTETEQVFNDHSKVHVLTDKSGLLVAGVYMPRLPLDVSRIASERGMSCVDQVAPLVKDEMEATWSLLESEVSPEQIAQARAFAFVSGFDSIRQPRLFYIDNRSNPPFSLQERTLFEESNDVEIGAMSTGSGDLENPSSMLVAAIQSRLPLTVPLEEALTSSFNDVKVALASQYERIGGETFYHVVRP